MTGFLKRYGWRYLPGAVFLLVSAYVQNMMPNLLGQVIDALSAAAIDTRAVYRLLGLMLLTAALAFITRYIWRYFINGNGRNMEAYLRDRLFTHLQSMSIHFYHYHKTGDLMAYAINDINAVRQTFGPALAMALNSLALAAIAVTNMAIDVDERLALFVLAPLPVIIAVMVLMGRQVRIRFRRVQEVFAAVSDRVQENISGLRVIKAYVQETAEVSRFDELNQSSRDANLRMTRISASMTPAVDLFFGVSFTVSLLYGGNLVRENAISLGDFVAFNGYLTLIVQPVRMIARIINILSRGLASLKRYNAILQEPPMVADGPDSGPGDVNHADVEVRRLSFRYPGDERQVLQDISFHIQPGKTLGILGRTGSGKTTLVNLLVRLYNVPDGTVFFGGVDANRLNLNRLRIPIGYVPQDNFLFSASVEDNIRFFNPAHDRAEVEQAAADAAILDNIRDFPKGFDTQVGERGMSLSGGQKQRICIARAMVKRPPLMILDDSLSAVDTRTEAAILKSVTAQAERRGSAVLIAHRVSALALCDEILVLDKGRIVERGTHQTLLDIPGGLYAAIAHDQTRDDGEGEADA